MPSFHSSQKTVEVEDVLVKRNTLKAILIETEDGEKQWIPKSQIERTMRNGKDVEPLEGDPPITLVITEWIAKEKGLL